MTVYINTKAQGAVETVDEFETRKEGLAMLKEYRISAPGMGYYLSGRCTKEWGSR
jgi:hypothetical protein